MRSSHRPVLLITVCAALLIVFAALRLRSATQTPPSFVPHRFGPAPLFTAENKEKVRQQIGISTEQQVRIEALYAESDRQRTRLRARLSDKMRASHALYENYVIDTAQEAALCKEIAGIQNDLFQVRRDTERKLRAILTPEQFARLRVLLSQQRDRARHDFRLRRPHLSPTP